MHLSNQLSAHAKSIHTALKGGVVFIFLSDNHISYLYATSEYQFVVKVYIYRDLNSMELYLTLKWEKYIQS